MYILYPCCTVNTLKMTLFQLRMAVSTCEKNGKKDKIWSLFTHIVVSQTTLPVLEASVCHTANSVHTNMYNTLAFNLSKPPWSPYIIATKSVLYDKINACRYPMATNIYCKALFLLLRMSVNTWKKKKNWCNIYHIIIIQCTLCLDCVAGNKHENMQVVVL